MERITEIEQSPRPLKEKLALTLRIHTTAAVDFDKMKMLVHDQRSLSPSHQEELNQKPISGSNWVSTGIRLLTLENIDGDLSGWSY